MSKSMIVKEDVLKQIDDKLFDAARGVESRAGGSQWSGDSQGGRYYALKCMLKSRLKQRKSWRLVARERNILATLEMAREECNALQVCFGRQHLCVTATLNVTERSAGVAGHTPGE